MLSTLHLITRCLQSIFAGDIDCYASLAHVALYNDWVKPTMVPTASTAPNAVNIATTGSSTPTVTPALVLSQLRHPLLEHLLGSAHYVPSSLTLSDRYACCLLTGPNMGGKSTFMRAVAISVILAHTGSYVPAASAVVPVVDKLFMRIGASDCTFTGESTFMREMCDVANILRSATDRSIVLIDELGECLMLDGLISAAMWSHLLEFQFKLTTLFEL